MDGVQSRVQMSKLSKMFLLFSFFLCFAVAASSNMESCVGGEMPTVLQFDDKSRLSEEVGLRVKEASDSAIALHGKFVIALSGGSLPKLLAEGLLKHAPSIAWDKWHVFFADERYVPHGHQDSNRFACETSFLSSELVNIPPAQVYGLDHSLSLEECALAYESQLQAVAGNDDGSPPGFDLVMLGMGPDGHTCSLFPGHDLLHEHSRWVAPISDSPKPPPERITLTLPVLNAADQVFFLATGVSKADVLPRVTCSSADLFAQADTALPAGRVRPSSGKLVWFVDQDAAAKL